MTFDDAEILKTAVGWVATVGGVMGTAITYLFFQVVALNKKVGGLEAEIKEYKEDIEEYKGCPVPHCYFRIRRLQREETQTVTTNNPQTA